MTVMTMARARLADCMIPSRVLISRTQAFVANLGSAWRTRLAAGAGPLLLVPVVLGAALVYQLATGVNRPAIRSDGVGYYAYLPLYFIHHSLDFSVLPINHAVYGFRASPKTGRLADLFPVGPALCMAPFFLAGHLVALVGGWPPDGSSPPYQLAVLAAALAWFAAGAYATWQVVAVRAGPVRASVALALLVAGTNLPHYVVAEPSLSHIYGFATFAVLLWFADRFWANPARRRAAAMGIAAGLLLSIRSYDILLASAALYPALWRSNRLAVRRNWPWFGLGMALALLPYIATSTYYLGAPWRTHYWNYSCHWGSPLIFTNLLSVRRGWWFWSPVAAIGVAGLAGGLFSRNLRWFCGISLAAIAIVTYIFASWGDPAVGTGATFGDGFGHRMYVDLLPVVAVGLAVIFTRIPRPIWWLLGLNLYLMVAYWNEAIPSTGANWSTVVRALRQPALWALGIGPEGDSRTPKGLSAEVSLVDARWDGDALAIDVAASNIGSSQWLADGGKGQVLLAIRTFGNDRCQGGSLGDWRFPISDNVPPGQTVRLAAAIPKAVLAAPHHEFFCAEMLSEKVAWFRDAGLSKMAVFKLEGDAIRIPSAAYPVIPFGRVLSFSSPEVEPLLGRGWAGTEPGFRWTLGPGAFLNFRTSPGRRLCLRLTAYGITADGRDQVVEFRIHRNVVGTFRWAKDQVRTIEVPIVPDSAGNVDLALHILHPLPKRFLPGDPRDLGLAVRSIQLVAADLL